MTGISGAVSISPSAEPTTSIVRLARRTLRNTGPGYHGAPPSAPTAGGFIPMVVRRACALSREPGVWLCLVPMAAPIKLTVPGTLRYRPVAVRVVAEAARLVSSSANAKDIDETGHDVRDPFDTAVVSAFMEIYNNVAIHAYERRDVGNIDLVITPN